MTYKEWIEQELIASLKGEHIEQVVYADLVLNNLFKKLNEDEIFVDGLIEKYGEEIFESYYFITRADCMRWKRGEEIDVERMEHLFYWNPSDFLKESIRYMVDYLVQEYMYLKMPARYSQVDTKAFCRHLKRGY